jgi:arylsulfatase A-like enzyme
MMPGILTRKFAWLIITVFMAFFLSKGDRQPEKPNILLIMVDDLGKEWIGCYGAGDIETTNIDALAKNGMLFTNAYSMPQCTPSRITLLTGTYPWRNGWVNHWDVPRYGVGYFDWRQKENVTFARILRNAGYRTAAAGKWQVNDFRIEPRSMEKHGFEDWCMWTGGEAQNPPSDKRYWDPYINTPSGSKTYAGRFGPDLFTDFLIDFMKGHAGEPIMLYFPMALTHTPFTTTPDMPDVDNDMAKHKAMVLYTDKIVGRLVQALEETGIRDKTIIIFTTDNGSSGSVTGRRNGISIPGGKSKKTENGVCAPFIVNCPGLVPSGVITDALTDFTDLFPTLIELSGAETPSSLIIDGKSIAPLLLGRAEDSPRDWIMALGHHRAKVDEKGIRGIHDYASRVIRDTQYKVWVDTNRAMTRLHDLMRDPLEEVNLIQSTEPGHLRAIEKFRTVLDALPEKDARPLYETRQALSWDVKYTGDR